MQQALPLVLAADIPTIRVIDAGRDLRVSEGTLLQFAVTGPDKNVRVRDPDRRKTSNFTYSWSLTNNIGDVVQSSTDTSFSFIAKDNFRQGSSVRDGRYTLTVSARDDQDGQTYSDSVDVFVYNVSPTSVQLAPVNLPATPREGTTLNFKATVREATLSDVLTYTWIVKRNDMLYSSEQRTSDSFSFRPDDQGVYTVTVIVNDDDDTRPESQLQSNTVTFTVVNATPVARINGVPTSALEGQLIALTGSLTDAGLADSGFKEFVWVVKKNGEAYDSGTAQNFSFTPNDNGTYTVFFSGKDKDDVRSATVSTTITVSNDRPLASILGALPTSPEGSQLRLSASVTDAGVLDTISSYAWSVTRNGTPYDTGTPTNLRELAFAPNDNGTYVVTLVVNDGIDASAAVSETITVTNVIPTNVTINGIPLNREVMEGRTLQLSSSAADVAASDSLVYAWRVTRTRGGNTTLYATGSQSIFNFTPNDDALYNISLTVRDDDMVAADAITVTSSIRALNERPTAVPNLSPQSSSLKEGTPFVFSLTNQQDAGTADQNAGFTYDFDLDGDGEFEVSNFGSNNRSMNLPASGQYLVRGRIRDKDGDTSEYSLAFEISNVAPTVSTFVRNGTSEIAEGSPITFSGTFTDPGADAWSGTVEITKTGSSTRTIVPLVLNADKSFTFPYIFPSAGTYALRATVTDGQAGAPVTRSISGLIVTNVAPLVDLGGNAQAVQGMEFRRTAAFIDPGLNTWSATVDYGDGTGTQPLPINDHVIELAHTYANSGLQTITVSLNDGTTTQSATMTVNVAANNTATIAGLSLNAATTTTVTVAYDVKYAAVGVPLFIDLVTSSDVQYSPEDSLLSRIGLTAAADLSVGPHTKTFTIGSGVGKVALPGNGAPELSTDYHVLAVISLPSGQTSTALRGSYLAGKDIMVHGSEDADSITISKTATDYQVTVGSTSYTYDATMTRVRVRSHGGADTLQASSSAIPVFAWGGNGDDNLSGGTVADWLDGGPGNDTLTGLAGNDNYQFGLPVDDEVDTVVEAATAGSDFLTFAALYAAFPATVDLTSDSLLATHVGRTVRTGAAGQAANFENVVGGPGDDTLIGNASQNSLNGGEGDDAITGGAGNDNLIGGSGVNTLVESGNVNFTLSNTSLVGLGTDTLSGFAEAILTGGAGNNVINAAAFTGKLIAIGGAGNDTITGGSDTSILLGGAGNDTLVSGTARDILVGGSGIDTLRGGGGDDLLIGGLLAYYDETTSIADLVALKAIREEWTSANNYAVRITNLQNGGANGTGLLNNTAITDDLAAIDQIFGELGTDWHLLNAKDVLNDREAAETVTVL